MAFEQAAHLRESRAARLLDVLERLPILRVGLRHPVPDRPHLEHHHAHGMRDDVVELARDPCRAPRPPRPGPPTPAPARPGRALLGGLGLLGSLPQREADEPADPEQRRGEDEVAGRGLGSVVDDDRRAAEHDRQADPCLRVAAQVAEQEGGAHPGEEEPGLVDDQLTVHERAAPH